MQWTACAIPVPRCRHSFRRTPPCAQAWHPSETASAEEARQSPCSSALRACHAAGLFGRLLPCQSGQWSCPECPGYRQSAPSKIRGLAGRPDAEREREHGHGRKAGVLQKLSEREFEII